MRKEGWIFDAYPEAEGMALWLLGKDGRNHKLKAPFAPSFYVDAEPKELLALLSCVRAPVDVEEVRKRDLYTNEEMRVSQATVQTPTAYPGVISHLQRHLPEREFFSCDVDIEQLFFYQTGLFPLARVEVETDGEGRLLGWELKDDPWSLDYILPPLAVMELGFEDSAAHPKQSRRRPALMVRVEGREYAIEPSFEVRELKRLLKAYNPHLIATDWGDDFLLSELSRLRGFSRIPFSLDGQPPKKRGRARSYFTYGKVMYSAPSYFFRGRWHVDRQNSFILHEAGADGLFELVRLSKTPLQKVARMSTGSVISAMQLETALRDGYLIPWRKATVEEPKTAEELLVIDKGGLVYQPQPGLYENVAEIDFASMYPSLIERYNLSPETMNCPCCPHTEDIPEAGYHTCRKRRGIVPRTVAPLLQKRAAYKARMKESEDPFIREGFDRRQTAIKWLLVTCFGYLGYKNARFGRIEAHEATTALSREKLLQAKEAAEERGFRLLHALTDCVWIAREGASQEDYERFVPAIARITGVPCALEGIYRWLAFVPSRENSKAGVPNRFFGLFANGKTKIRGIEYRRSDTCAYVRQAQKQMLEVLWRAKGKEDYLASIPEVLETLDGFVGELREGRVPVGKLALSRRLSREPMAYEKASTTAVAAQELAALGAEIHAGERVKFIMTDSASPIPGERAKALPLWDGSRGYDAEWYVRELLKAAASLAFPADWDFEALRERYAPEAPSVPERPPEDCPGPLFRWADQAGA